MILRVHRSRHTKREGALSKCEKLITELRSEGFQVLNSPPPKRYRVYVMRLSENLRPGKPCVYVGQTAKSPEERMEQHRMGRISGRGFRGEDVVGLVRGLAPEDPMTELESLRLERQLAAKLRKKGYAVLGGH